MATSPGFGWAARACAAGLVSLALLAGPLGAETVELIPRKRASWSARYLIAPLTGLFLGGPGYWYDPRRIEIETTPPSAFLDLFYVRGSFQQAFEQAESPVTLVLPSRIEASDRDSVTIRAQADGFAARELNVRVRSRVSHVRIDLEPLPNQLTALAHSYLAGRGALRFFTREALTFRLQPDREGFSVVLTETAAAPELGEVASGVESALVASLKLQQLGSDLMVRVALRDDQRDRLEIRSRQSQDPIRDRHVFTLDLVPADGSGEDVGRALAALAQIRPGHAAGCAFAFDSALREELDPAELARALTPSGGFLDRYLRAAMKRLGEVSPGGVVHFTDGSSFDTAVPIELAAATSQASTAQGFLALLRQFVADLEPPAQRGATLRGLLAPELSPSAFAGMLERAEAQERECLARSGGPAASGSGLYSPSPVPRAGDAQPRRGPAADPATRWLPGRPSA